MKLLKNLIYSLLVFIIIISGCSNKNNSSRKPVTNIQFEPSNNIVEWGNDFTIHLDSKIKNLKIKKIELFADNKLIKSSDLLGFSVILNSKDFLPGNLPIKVISTKEDGEIGINNATILITSDVKPKKLQYKIIGNLPHNTQYFTEGFEFFGDKLFEGTGNNGSSLIASYNPSNGKIYNSLKIDNQYFGEGITILNDKIYQLTYKAQKGFIYNLNNFSKIGEFNFDSEEGWGLTNDGKNLIMSDGTSKIHFIDPENFKKIKSIEVCDNNGVISNINELEYVNGVIYSNIWMTETILKIDANTGKVLAYINMNGIQNQFNKTSIDVLNGIAFNKKEDLFYITGKYWPKIFKVKFE
jgi:glutaminyl-peptide cyclotransferase